MTELEAHQAIHRQAMSDTQALAEILTGTREVQVTIVATVTVPADQHGNWLQSDAVAAAAWAVREGRADYKAHEVDPTGAPGPVDADQVTQDLADLSGMTPDEVTAWTPGKRI